MVVVEGFEAVYEAEVRIEGYGGFEVDGLVQVFEREIELYDYGAIIHNESLICKEVISTERVIDGCGGCHIRLKNHARNGGKQ